MSGDSDATLIERSGATPEAFGEVIHRHHPAVYRYVARRLGAQTAEDVVSDTFATAFAVRDRFDRARSSALPWLLGIATNHVRIHRRKEAAALRALARSGVDPVASPGMVVRAIDPSVAAALAGLKPRYRDVLFLHAIAELSTEEIAQAMDVPLGTAKSWLHRARVAAQTELAKGGVGPTDTPVPPIDEATEA